MEPSQTPSSRTVQTPLKQQKGGWTTFPFILGAVMGLSLAAGGWASNLIVFFMSEFNIKSVTAAQINNVVLGCNSLVPFAGAIIADSSSFGSFSVVVLFAFPSLMRNVRSKRKENGIAMLQEKKQDYGLFCPTIIGVGEGFHFPGQVALYYQEFPKSLRSTSTAMISFQVQNRGED